MQYVYDTMALSHRPVPRRLVAAVTSQSHAGGRTPRPQGQRSPDLESAELRRPVRAAAFPW